MTINTNPLNVKINSDSVGNLTELELLQLADSTSTLENSRVYSVASLATLPVAADNTGRFIFVNDIQDYRYSDGLSWIRDYNSTVEFLPATAVVWTWGANYGGRLGDSTIVAKSSPVSVVGGFTNWCQVSAGNQHISAIRTNGTLWAWGCNICGILGDNTSIAKSSPISVVGGFTDWCQVSAGNGRHTAAIRTNGTIWSWGYNSKGQLGDGSTLNKTSPVSVVGGFLDWCQVSVGNRHTAAIRTNCTIWSWGYNNEGQLGSGFISASALSPVSVVGGFLDWCQVSAGNQHTAAVRTNGSLWAWGRNIEGQLGDNSTIVTAPKSSPVSVAGGFTDWCQVSAGRNHNAAVRTNGTLWTWGLNSQGQLGDNTIVSKHSPISVVGGFTDWCQVSAGSYHTAAVRTNGSIWTWGYNAGQLGDNTTVSKSSPVSVVGGVTDWCQVSAGGFHTAALRLIPCRGFNTP